jgi:CRP/FNR family transcriptional regulator, cyclic AMP receptor protein
MVHQASIPTLSKADSLRGSPLFAHLSDDQWRAIAGDMVERRYAPDDVIFYEGDPGQVLYLLAAGQVRIYVHGVDGSETSVILFGRPGEMFGELAVVDELPRSATAVAMHQTTLFLLSRENFRKHMQQCPQFALNFLQELTLRVRYNTRQMDSLASLTIAQRLARKLIELAHNYGRAEADGVVIDLALSQTDLANLIGATRESANKSLREFRRQQWISLRDGRFIIHDPDALRAQGGGGTVNG